MADQLDTRLVAKQPVIGVDSGTARMKIFRQRMNETAGHRGI